MDLMITTLEGTVDAVEALGRRGGRDPSRWELTDMSKGIPAATVVTVAAPVDGVVEIALQGEIDIDNAYQIRDAVDAVLTAAPPGIRLDLRQVTLVDSVGIGVLVACYYAAAAGGVIFVVSNPTRTVYRQLWVAGVVGLFGSPEPIPDPPLPAQPGWADW
jgi:anti-anti-sigma factor